MKLSDNCSTTILYHYFAPLFCTTNLPLFCTTILYHYFVPPNLPLFCTTILYHYLCADGLPGGKNWRKMADADTELLATMMLEGTVPVPDDDTIPTTETVQPEGDTECPGQAEGSLGQDNLESSRNSPPKRKFYKSFCTGKISMPIIRFQLSEIGYSIIIKNYRIMNYRVSDFGYSINLLEAHLY